MFHIWRKNKIEKTQRKRGPKAWSEKDEKFIFENYKAMAVEEMARRIGRSTVAVDSKLRREMSAGVIEQYPLLRELKGGRRNERLSNK